MSGVSAESHAPMSRLTLYSCSWISFSCSGVIWAGSKPSTRLPTFSKYAGLAEGGKGMGWNVRADAMVRGCLRGWLGSA